VLVLLALVFLVLPIVELYVIVQVAQSAGILETIGLLVLVGAVGAWLCKREGVGVLRRIRDALDRYELPHRELADGGLILFAGALLLTPGFVTDCLALLLLLPPTRAVVRGALLGALARRSAVGMVVRRVVDTTGSERR
jgi:UPF0716 protein FxsA